MIEVTRRAKCFLLGILTEYDSQPEDFNIYVRGSTLIETLKPLTLARHHGNHLHELFYDRRSW